jgi:dihydrolipoamide dehydrogenase
MPADHFDAVLLGAGPGGRHAAQALAAGGMTVAVVEAELVGGECPYWACIPSKTLLRPVEVRAEAAHVPGLGATPAPDWAEVRAYLEYMTSGLDDAKKTRKLQDQGIEVVRGRGRLDDEGGRVVRVGARVLRTERVVVATGTTTALPPVDGLADVPFWTNREATTLREVPSSVVVLGSGPVGTELAQMLVRFGSEVTLAEPGPCPLPRGEDLARRHVRRALEDDGVAIRDGAAGHAVAVRRDGPGVEVRFEDGGTVGAAVLLVATGRRPRVDGLGLEAAGVRTDHGAVVVDDHLRAADGVWAVGDVTGVAPFTHVASYQARIAAADMLGRPVAADYRGIPRVVFTDPEVAAVGPLPEDLRAQGVEVLSHEVELSATDRTPTYGRDLHGGLVVHADPVRRVLVGATGVGPLASEWIHTLALAIRAEVPVEVVADAIFQFPTFSELVASAVRGLDL